MNKLTMMKKVLRTPRFRRMTWYSLGCFVSGMTSVMTLDTFFGIAVVTGFIQGILAGAYIGEWIRYFAYSKEAKADLSEARTWAAKFETAVANKDVYRMQIAIHRRVELIQRVDRWIALAEDHDNCDAPWTDHG